MSAKLELVGWRREVSELYAAVRAEKDAGRGHTLWRQRKDELMRTHPQSPLPAGHPLRETGLPYWPYDPACGSSCRCSRRARNRPGCRCRRTPAT